MPRSNSVSGGCNLMLAKTFPNSVARPVRTTSALLLPLMTCVPMKRGLVRRARAVSREKARHLFYRIGLTRQRGFVDEQIAAFQEPTISRNDRACREEHDIAGNNLLDRHGLLGAVAQHAHLGLDNRAQLAMALAGPCSCQKPRSPLAMTMARIMAASFASPRKAERIAAEIRIRMIGLLNCSSSMVSGGNYALNFSRTPDFGTLRKQFRLSIRQNLVSSFQNKI